MGGQRPERFQGLREMPVRMVQTYDVDLLLLVEPFCDGSELAATLSRGGPRAYHDAPSDTQRIQILSRLPQRSLIKQYDSADGRVTIRRVSLHANDFLLVVVHFPSQLHLAREEQALEATVLHRTIVSVEATVGHQRTMLVGDLNMDPYDHGLVAAQGLHAVMTRQIARRGERTVAGNAYPFFYNPMWGLFGDRMPGPPGTYYRSPTGAIAYHWHLFDQILLRPDLMDRLQDLRILDSDGKVSLLTADGHPRSSAASDHLPIHFRLDLVAPRS